MQKAKAKQHKAAKTPKAAVSSPPADDRMVLRYPLKDLGMFLQVRRDGDRIIDDRPLYWLTDRDLSVLLRWWSDFQPQAMQPDRIEATLVRHCGIRPANCRALSMLTIISLLEDGLGGRLQLADFTPIERSIITEKIGRGTKKRIDLSRGDAGNIGKTLTSLTKRSILTNAGRRSSGGYRVAKSYLYLLDEAEGIN